MSMRDRLFWEERHEIDTREKCRSALDALAALPINEFDYRDKSDSHPIFGVNGHYIRTGHVRDAIAALEAMDGLHTMDAPPSVVSWEAMRSAIVLAISFLARDVGTDRINKTVESVLIELRKSDSIAREDAAQSSKPRTA